MEFMTKEYIDREIFLLDNYWNSDLRPAEVIPVFIDDTRMLEQEVDRIRKAKGYLPFFAYDEPHDDEAWYDFFVDISADTVVSLYAEVVNSDTDDSYETGHPGYELELTEEQKGYLYERIKSLLGDYNWKRLFSPEEVEA